MRSIWRTLDRSDLTGIAAVCLAVGIIGVSYGASTVTAGLPAWLPILLSVLVLAGGAEFLFVGIVAAGGSLVAAVLVGLVVNARHLPYGLALPEVVGTGWRRLLGTHVMNDEAVALALAEPDRDRRHARYWLCGFGVLLAWPLGAALGVAIGATVPDPSRFGLDAVFPAVLLALAVPALRDKATRRAVVVGAAIAAVTAPFLAAGIPVLLALPAALLAYNRQRFDETIGNESSDEQSAERTGRERDNASGSERESPAGQQGWLAAAPQERGEALESAAIQADRDMDERFHTEQVWDDSAVTTERELARFGSNTRDGSE
ncbi:AzlC family ABC transporter permease [Nocardia pseudobrasiliensis]|uniref:AzlC family ABC transporter permease n=1 Tax=Nocardia pseudobrasiliensis TaxID=45979 RepID=UPI0009EF262A